MEFGNRHWAIHLVWLVPAIAGVIWFGYTRRRKRLAAIAPGEDQRRTLTASLSVHRRVVRMVLMLLAIGFTFMALLRPQLGVETLGRPVVGRDVLIVLDVSRSMLARDAKPSRLNAAKAFVEDLVDALPGDRFGLIAFAGKPQLMCPITANRMGFRLVLGNTDTRSVPRGGTDLEAALKRALAAFKGAEADYRAIVLLSDGEELQGNISGILGKLRERKIPVYAVGFGDTQIGSLIQLENGKFVTEDGRETGKKVRTRLDEEALRKVAAAGSGIYVHSTLQIPGIERIAGSIRDLNRREVGVLKSVRPIERYQVPLGIAVLCLLGFFLIGERKMSRATVPFAILMILVCNVHTVAGGRPDGQIRVLKRAIQNEKDPDEKIRLTYNLARHLHGLGELDRAEVLYDELLQNRRTPTRIRAAIYQNLGAIRHAAGDTALKSTPKTAATRYQEAIHHYEESLRLQTDDDVAHNLALARLQMKTAIKKAREKQEAAQRHRKALELVRKALRQQEDANSGIDDEDWQKRQQQAHATAKQAQPHLDALKNQSATHEMQAALAVQEVALQVESEGKRRNACLQAAMHLREILKSLGETDAPQQQQRAGRQRKNGTPQVDPQKDPEAKTPLETALKLLRQANEDERRLKEEIKNKDQRYRYYERGGRNW